MRTSRKIIGAFILAMALFMVPAAAAQASPFTISVDNAILDLGSLSGVRAIDSELEPPDPPATLSGDLTGNTVNVPKAGFVFPTKSAEVSAGITADIDMEANEDITGTFDAATGKLVLDVSLKATVGVLGSTCVISPIALQLSSDNANPYLGQEFAGGIEGNGVIDASWAGLPPVTGGGSCGIVAGLIAGPGGIAMSHGVHDFKTCETDPDNTRCDVDPSKPTVAPKITTAPPATTEADIASFSYEKGAAETADVTGFDCSLDGAEFQACDSGSKTYTGVGEGAHTFQVKATNGGGAGPVAEHKWTVKKDEVCPLGTTGTPPDCIKPDKPKRAKLGALKIKPKVKAIKRGKNATFKVKVKNAGGNRKTAKGVKVCVKVPKKFKKFIKVKKCVKVGNLAAGKSKTRKFKVKVTRRAKKGKKVTLNFKATSKNAGAKSTKAKVKVK